MKIAVPEVDDQLFSWMQKIRRTLHQNPELSFKEFQTSALIQQTLKELDLPFESGYGGTGVVATLTGGKPGSGDGHVALRADMDALPIQEENQTSYASTVPGVMHACGHDGHVAMLLGAAALLQKSKFNGRISLIFQPAEEHGNGAENVIADGALAENVAAIFAGHIDTHFPTGTITVDEGTICSWADPFSITLSGKSGHAARPHEARDTIVAGAYLVSALQTLVSRETDPNSAAVITIGRFMAGSANNVIAENAVLDGSLRNCDAGVRKEILEAMQRMVDSVAVQFRLAAKLTFYDCLPAVVNAAAPTRIARQAAREIVGEKGVISQGKPSLGAEDFAFYQQHVAGCMVRFGALGDRPFSPAHCGSFDFDEKVLAVGARWLAMAALNWLCQRDMQ